MRIIMFGTGPFAVPTFKSLLASDHAVPLLVTRPIADGGKRRKSSENPTRDAGEEAGIEIYDPRNINAPDSLARLASCQADLFVVCDYGQILSSECLNTARLGGINLHGSLLPRYRGAAPINWAIYNGDTRTGVTVILMSARMDAGNCLATAEMEIGPAETAESIEPKLAQLGVQPVHQAIAMLETWDGQSAIGQKQDREQATRAPRLNKSDGRIDWSRTAIQIGNHVRAFKPWPGTFTEWKPADRKPLRLIIQSGHPVPTDNTHPPGSIISSTKTELVIQTGHDGFSIDRIQPAGKREMEIAEFLRGYQPTGKFA